MNDLNKEEINILFSQAHNEQLVVAENAEGAAQFSSLRQVLTDLKYRVNHTNQVLTSEQLADAQVLVIGAPKYGRNEPERVQLDQAEVEAIKQFVARGGGLLLLSNAETMIDPPPGLDRLTEIAGLKFQEYLNYPLTFLQIFRPHYITANVKRIKVGKIASLEKIGDKFRPLAFTKATRQLVMACAKAGHGRVVAIGDLGWLTDDCLADESNKELAANTFGWLAAHNVIEIEDVTTPETVKWGQPQPATVVLRLRNNDAKKRLQVGSILESDADARIPKPAHKTRTIPPGKTTQMRWTVNPRVLGEQELRLAVYADGYTPLFFDQLPGMRCLAPGYFTLEIKDKAGKLKTAFQTGDYFTVEGTFQWASELAQLPYQLKLEFDDGLVERGNEQGDGVSLWYLQATAPGEYKLSLSLVGTDQSLPALVTVTSSMPHRVTEIKTAYVYPLDAEIAERLRQVDESLSHDQIWKQRFEILPPEQFIQAVHKGETALWLRGVLASARREQWYNRELLDLLLIYIAPTYLPNFGSFIPYDPGLASSLARLHPANRRYLEYNLLCSEESESINIKQNVAAYLLHEKYGHGFFYTQTRLGQQLAILQRHGFPDEPEEHYTNYKEVAQLIEDSAIIVNEGFAAWLEITFLGKLDHEVRQAVYPRRILLIQEATGLNERARRGGFFQTFPPHFDSRYREGFEYLDFISQEFNLRCAVRALLVATHVEFGITEDAQGRLQFALGPAEIKQMILDPAVPDWRSHFRLRKIAELLYEHSAEAKELVRRQHCPTDCLGNCPLEAFIADKLNWRVP